MSRKWDSKRVISNTTIPGTALNRYAGINRKLVTTGSAYTGIFRFMTLPRRIAETVKTAGGLRWFIDIVRRITLQAGNNGTAKPVTGFKRDITTPVKVSTTVTRHPVFLRTLLNTITAGDDTAYSVVWLRRLPEQGTVTDKNRHIGGYIRGLYMAAGSLAGTRHRAEYYRKQTDVVNGQGVSLRYLFIFIRLLTTGLVRDYLLRRFLKSNEELVLKSPVCREIVLESRIHG
jgi:hypothetical protein